MFKVVVCWSDISGYMESCWRALSALPEIELFTIAFQARTQSVFTDDLMKGIPCRLLDIQERENFELIERLASERNPDVIVLCGWFHKPYRQLAFSPRLKGVKLILCMDTPWWGKWKQYLKPWLLRAYLQKMAYVVVNGERSWQYARRLGIPQHQISSLGMCGIDYRRLAPLLAERERSPWPRSFLYVGRYSPEKGIDTLVAAYQQYRRLTSEPWNLICCGNGDLEVLVRSQPGIENRGFLQPDELPDAWLGAGAFLMPSHADAWPLALVEAAASGLPVIATQTCGSSVEVIRSGYNGIVVPSDDPRSLAKALLEIQTRYHELPIWGKRAQQHAEPYSAEHWAERWLQVIRSVCEE